MAAFFFDIDGTTVQFHGLNWLPGVVEKLTALKASGHQIHFITMRDRTRDTGTAWSIEETERLISELPFQIDSLLTNVQSPRVVVCDHTPIAIQAVTNHPQSWMGVL